MTTQEREYAEHVLRSMLDSIGSQHWRTIFQTAADEGNHIDAVTAMSIADKNVEKWEFVQEFARSLDIDLSD